MSWQLQEAKNKLSEVVNSSVSVGPQIISRHGKNTAVLLSYEEYKKLTSKKKPAITSKRFNEIIKRTSYVKAGRKFTREEMNER